MTTKAQDNETLTREVQKWLGVTVDGWAGPATLSAWIERNGNGVKVAESQSLTDSTKFFLSVRNHFGALNQGQVDGLNALLKAMEAWPISWAAYGLATAWHETAHTLQPIKEYGGPAYYKRMYDIEGERPAKAKELGNLTPGDGVKYAGRGYIQLTGKANYARYGIENDPDAAMRPDKAAEIMVHGMEKGVFTGKKLSDYLPGDYVEARRVINGKDKAHDIAAHARTFEDALTAGGW